MRKASRLIFDLDGTISDPSLGIGRCLNFALKEHGYEQVSDKQIAAAIGPPLDQSFREFCPGADTRLVADLVATYRERYAEVGYSENSIYSGIEDVLKELFATGIPLAVCTSKRRDFAQQILEMFDLLKYFDIVDGGDIGIEKSQQIAGLIQSGKVDSLAVMIGDRKMDISAAKKNGLRAVGVLWGFGSESELIEAGADVTLEHTCELRSLS